MSPTVSIGMPVYNGGKYIREALDSLLAQTFTDFELIVSDNASTDETEVICRAYASIDTRIKYVRQSENMGPVENFQFVLDESVGEYFMWAAADDVWDSRWIATLFTMSSKHQCLAYGFVQCIDENGQRIDHPANIRKFEFTGNRLIRRCKYYLAIGYLGKANPIYGIIPASYLKESGFMWLKSEDYGGDMIFLYVLLNRMEIRHAEGVFLYKRLHAEYLGGGVRQYIDKPNAFARFIAFLRERVKTPMLSRYIKRSSAIESMLLAAVYPACIVLGTTYGIFYKLQRMLKNV